MYQIPTINMVDTGKNVRYNVNRHREGGRAAKNAGVVEPKDYAVFQNRGYQGLYGGLGARDIQARKGLKKSQHIIEREANRRITTGVQQ